MDGDRRVRRTQRALKEAFVSLVLEHGYEKVSIEEIITRADVARATFYAHYGHKEDLLTAVFSDLVEEAFEQNTADYGPWDRLRSNFIEESYRHAAELRDLYLVCLGGAGDGQARRAYTDAVANSVVANVTARQRDLGIEPKVPVTAIARLFAGAHVELLYTWLLGDNDYTPAEMAVFELKALIRGLGWAQGMSPDQQLLASEVPDETTG